MFLVGLGDDIFSFRPGTKLVAQIVLASTLLFFGYRLDWTESLTLSSVLTVFWVVGITNAFNLLDNMDGLLPGVSQSVLLGGPVRQQSQLSVPQTA